MVSSLDPIDVVLSWGGSATSQQRAARLLKNYRADLHREMATWRSTAAALAAEGDRLEELRLSQEVKLVRWGLASVAPAFSALGDARARRARLQRDMAAAAFAALEARAGEALAVGAGPGDVVEARAFTGRSPGDVLGAWEPLVDARRRLDACEAEVEDQAAAVRALQPVIERRSGPRRRETVAAAAGALARGDAASREAAELDVEGALLDQREREGRLLARWLDKVRGQPITPREIVGFANYFAEHALRSFAVPPDAERALRSRAARLAHRRATRRLLVPPNRRPQLEARDARYRERRAVARAAVVLDDRDAAAAAVGVGDCVEINQ